MLNVRFVITREDKRVFPGMSFSMKQLVSVYVICCFDRFNEGGYLYLKSSIMRTQGAKEQRMAVIDTPRKHMKVVVEVSFLLFDNSIQVEDLCIRFRPCFEIEFLGLNFLFVCAGS